MIRRASCDAMRNTQYELRNTHDECKVGWLLSIPRQGHSAELSRSPQDGEQSGFDKLTTSRKPVIRGNLWLTVVKTACNVIMVIHNYWSYFKNTFF